MLKVKLILRIRIHVIVYLCFDYHSVSNIIAILISNTMYGIGQDGASKAKRKKGRERCHVSGLWDPSLMPRPNASAAAGGLHHRYACKRSGDVIHPQLRCIGSGHETSSDHEVIAMKRLPFTQLEAIFNKANSEHLVPCEHSDITVSMETDSVVDELFVGKIIDFRPSPEEGIWEPMSPAIVNTVYKLKFKARDSKGQIPSWRGKD